MPLQRITHSGVAPPTGLNAPISATDMSFTLTSPTGYPTGGGGGPFVLDIDPGTPSEEKILCSSLSGSSVTVAPGGRGWDGTSPAAHNAGALNVTHVITSAEADDSNAHIYVPTRDDHTQYVRTDGTRSVTGGLTVAGGLTVGGAINGSSNVVAGGTVQGQVVDASGVPGATNPARFVGQTAGDAPPGAGTWQVGDFVTTAAGTIWVCTTAGTPGTWTKVGAAAAGVTQIVAGDNIVISPAGGTGVVSIFAELGNVQTYITTGVSLPADTNTPVVSMNLTGASKTWLFLVNLRVAGSAAYQFDYGLQVNGAWIGATSFVFATGSGEEAHGYSFLWNAGGLSSYTVALVCHPLAGSATALPTSHTLGLSNSTGLVAVQLN